MKRFLVIFLSVFLILPVLLVPCFAVSEDIISSFRAEYTSIVEGESFYQSDIALVSGWYKFSLSFPEIHRYFVSDPVYVSFTHYSAGVLRATLTFHVPLGDGTYSDLPAIIYVGDSITVISGPAFMGAAVYPGSYITLKSVQTGVVSSLASVGSAVLSWISSIVAVIVERPLLLFTVGIFFVGGCIALFSRFLSRD